MTPLCRYEMVDQQKREMKKKAELEKRFKQNGDKADGAADGAEGDATDTDSDEEDDDKITEAQDAGGWRSHAFMDDYGVICWRQFTQQQESCSLGSDAPLRWAVWP